MAVEGGARTLSHLTKRDFSIPTPMVNSKEKSLFDKEVGPLANWFSRSHPSCEKLSTFLIFKMKNTIILKKQSHGNAIHKTFVPGVKGVFSTFIASLSCTIFSPLLETIS